MADNTTLDPGAGGDPIVTREISHAGDTAKLQGVFAMGISGNEGSYTAEAIGGDAANGIDVDVTRVGGTVAVSNAGLTELAAAIDTEVQCDIVGALPAGNNNIGDVDIASIAAGDNNIGNVDIVTMPSVTLAASTGTQEVVGDVAHDAPAAGNPVLVAGYASAAAPTDVSGDADAVRAWHLRNGAQATVITAAGALIGGDAANGLDVDITRMAALVASSANIGDVDVLTVPTDPFGANADAASATGSISAKLRFIAGTGIPITGTVTLAASTGTQEVVGDVAHDAPAAGNPVLLAAYASAAAPTDVSGDADAVRIWALRNGSPVVNMAYGGTLLTATTTQETVGDVADDIPTAGNPVLIAGVAVETDGTDPTTVSAEGDAAYLRTDRQRNLLVNVTHPRCFNVSADYGSAQTNASVKAAPGASLSLYITDLIISNGATAGNVTLLDGSGGTVVFEFYPAINGGVAHSFRNPIRLTANTALCITSTTVTTHSINVCGYIAP